MPYTYRLRTPNDDNGEVELGESAVDIRLVGDAWHVEAGGSKWKVTKVTAGDATRPAAIVLEPID